MRSAKGFWAVCNVGLVLFGGLLSSPALGQYGIKTVEATPVFVFLDQVPAGVPTTYETQILTHGGDSVIHVVQDAAPFQQLAANDDCGGAQGNHGQGHEANLKPHLASCVTITVAAPTQVRVLVRAADNRSFGRANLLRNGVRVATDFRFAGTVVKVSWSTDDVFETPLASPVAFSGAATDTQLLLIGDPPLGLVAYDDDSGVGLGSRLTAPAGSNGKPFQSAVASYLVVGSTSEPSSGPARLVQNDVLKKDTDGDGLGDQLEAFVDPAGYLPTNPLVADTDGDGISDGWELLGRDGAHPQILSRWGASPRHRDLFIEVDIASTPPFPGATLSAPDAQALATRLSVWPTSELHNPDGRDGVSVHVDNGVIATSEVYGDFGGSETLSSSDLLLNYSQHFATERIGVFMYALARGGCEETPYLLGDRVVFASTCGDFAWQNLAYNLTRNLSAWGASCCDYRNF